MDGRQSENDRVLTFRHRRSDYDVTNSVQVSEWQDVCEAVHDIFARLYPGVSFQPLHRAFQDFDRLFRGRMPGYLGCDTVYHDIQHTLDMVLAMARLIQGHEESVAARDRLGPARSLIGLITGLFHDAGYIRHAEGESHVNGAEFTGYHVTRSAQFLDSYLSSNGMAPAAGTARQIVHFTGYEVLFEQIRVRNRGDRVLGHIMGTADLISQMSDRCYLEKCRDRLFPEFVLGGVAMYRDGQGRLITRYRSGLDLLRQTPEFFRNVCQPRLENDFGGAYRYLEVVFDGRNPYQTGMQNNLFYLEKVLAGERWPLLRRKPPCVLWEQESIENMRRLVAERLRDLRSEAA